MSFDLKCTYANDLCTFNEVEYCFSGCEIVKPCPQALSPMVDQLLGIWSLYHHYMDSPGPNFDFPTLDMSQWSWDLIGELKIGLGLVNIFPSLEHTHLSMVRKATVVSQIAASNKWFGLVENNNKQNIQ